MHVNFIYIDFNFLGYKGAISNLTSKALMEVSIEEEQSQRCQGPGAGSGSLLTITKVQNQKPFAWTHIYK